MLYGQLTCCLEPLKLFQHNDQMLKNVQGPATNLSQRGEIFCSQVFQLCNSFHCLHSLIGISIVLEKKNKDIDQLVNASIRVCIKLSSLLIGSDVAVVIYGWVSS
jgi:hypothetical protein